MSTTPEEKAEEYVVLLIQRLSKMNEANLDSIDDYHSQAVKQKEEAEKKLRTLVQGYLDDMEKNLAELQNVPEYLGDAEAKIKDVNKEYEKIEMLAKKICQEDFTETHKRWVEINEQIRMFLDQSVVTSKIEEARNNIELGKFLLAHKTIMELEQSRDRFRIQTKRNPSLMGSSSDAFDQFKPVGEISAYLNQQILLCFSKIGYEYKSNPHKLAACVRIIEREEYLDNECMQKYGQKPDEMPEGRPKNLKSKMIEKLRSNASDIVEGAVIDEEDEMWFVQTLEAVKDRANQDLFQMHSAWRYLFPPKMNINEMYQKFYIDALKSKLQEVFESIVSCESFDQKKASRQASSLIQWYYAEYTRGEYFSQLLISEKRLPPLIEDEQLSKLEAMIVESLLYNFNDWGQKVLDQEKKMLESISARPLEDLRKPGDEVQIHGVEMLHRRYYTNLSIDLFETYEQTLALAEWIKKDELKDEFLCKALISFMESLDSYNTMLRSFVDMMITQLMSNRFFDKHQCCDIVLMAALNNSHQMGDRWTRYFDKYQGKCVKFRDRYSAVEQVIESQHEECIGLIVEWSLAMVVSPFTEYSARDILAQCWYRSTDYCTTMVEYLMKESLDLLKTHTFGGIDNVRAIAERFERPLAALYLNAIMNRMKNINAHYTRMKLDSADKREAVAKQIKNEVLLLKDEIDRLTGGDANDERMTPLKSVLEVCKVIECDDEVELPLKLYGLLRLHPDMTEQHAVAIIAFRNDGLKGRVVDTLTASKKAKELYKKTLEDLQSQRVPHAITIFTQMEEEWRRSYYNVTSKPL